MSITISTSAGDVTADELFDGYSKGIAGGPRVEKKYLVPWDVSDAFANAIMGIENAVGNVAGTIYRTFGHQCPESPNLTALSVGPIEGCGVPIVDDGRPKWEWAVVPVVYGVAVASFGTGGAGDPDPYNLFTPDGQAYPFCSFKITAASETLAARGGSLMYAEGPLVMKPVQDSLVSVRLRTATIVCDVHRVPWLPTDAMLDLVNLVNDATFFGRPAGTIMYENGDSSREPSSEGVMATDIRLVFQYREKGWNSAPLPNDVTSFYRVSHDGTLTGRPPHALADLRPLLFGVTLAP